MEVRLSNMTAAKAISDAVRTSLGPKGMDKMVSQNLSALTANLLWLLVRSPLPREKS